MSPPASKRKPGTAVVQRNRPAAGTIRGQLAAPPGTDPAILGGQHKFFTREACWKANTTPSNSYGTFAAGMTIPAYRPFACRLKQDDRLILLPYLSRHG